MRRVFYILLLAIAFSAGCNNKVIKEQDNNESLASIKDTAPTDSLMFWTSDTILNTNPELVLLLDPLYRYVRNDGVKPIREELEWMNEYRNRLCSYYDTHQLGETDISEYAKADTVLNVAKRLYSIDEDWSTMGMIISNSIYYTFETYRQYGLLAQLIEKCKDAESVELLYRECDLYNKMSDVESKVVGDIIDLNYCGGSIVGPLRTASYIQITKARQDMLKTIIDICNDDQYNDNGVFLTSAKLLLFDTQSKAINTIYEEMANALKEIGKEDKELPNIANDANKLLTELRPLVDEWIEIWPMIDERMTPHDSSRHSMERVASNLLIQWSILASTN
jgi:hypothetical protein